MSMQSSESLVPTSNKKLIQFSLRDAGTLVGLLVIIIVLAFIAPGFMTVDNWLNILQQSSINALIALGMTLVIISGGIDLSVGPVAAVSSILGAALMIAGVPIPLAILGALLTGALCGAFSGYLVAYAGLQPFIVTLGGLSLFRAIALIYTDGNPIFGIPNDFRVLTNSTIFSVPVPILIVAFLVVVLWIVMNKTPLGEYILAVGGNEEAARVAGVPVKRTKVTVFIISGMLASLAALILLGRLGAADPTLGNLWELDAIAAAAIGGASLMGGKGSVIGTIIGAIILGALRNGLTLLNIQAFYQLLATGIIIIIAMLIDRATRGKG